MEYAVVLFKDGSVSEVPTSWLDQENNKCFWPKTKNPSVFMIKKISPSDDWEEHEVTIECFCSSLEKARKKAENITYTSESDNDRGRGKRPKKRNFVYSGSTTDEECVTNKRKLTPPRILLPWNTQFGNEDLSENSQEESQILFNAPSVTPASRETTFVPEIVDDIVENIIEDPLTQSQEIEELRQGDDDETNIDLRSSQNCDHGTILKKILYSVTESKLMIKEIHQNFLQSRIDKEAFQEIKALLPIDNIEELRRFENFCERAENNSLLLDFLKCIGGRDLRENVHRILNILFKNSFAVKCSWLGQRNNIRIADLHVMQLTKRVILESYKDTSKTFEEVCSNWLRHAKQRLTRGRQTD